MSGGAQIDVRVTRIDTIAERVKRFRLEPITPGALPPFSAGAHVVVTMHEGTRTYRNPYSLMGSTTDCSCYHISVLETENSRGGSKFMHRSVAVGTTLTISNPVNLFPIDQRGRKHILFAGGIGITPLMAMAEQLDRHGQPFELHYCVRNDQRGAYLGELKSLYGDCVRIYRDDAGEKLPLAPLLDNRPLGTQIYICGPEGMIQWILASAESAGWPEENVHVERFLAAPAGEPFVVELARSNKSVAVGPHQSILDAVEAAGVDVPYLCRGGACGQCETAVVCASGEIVHNDHYLSKDEHCSGKKIMVCVSRFKGSKLVLDL